MDCVAGQLSGTLTHYLNNGNKFTANFLQSTGVSSPVEGTARVPVLGWGLGCNSPHVRP